MSVGTFVQPDFAVQAPSAVKTSIQNCISVHNRIAGSFAPHEQAVHDMTVRIDAGSLMVLGNVLEVLGQSTAAIVPPTSPIYRIDRVLINSTSGVYSVVSGDPYTVTPDIPDITVGCIPICQVLLTAGMTEITNLLITDERIMGGGAVREGIAIGGIYMTVSANNPNVDLGYGTWVEWGSGKIPMGLSATEAGFDHMEDFGGSKTIDAAHSHSVDCPSHTHQLGINNLSREGWMSEWGARTGDPESAAVSGGTGGPSGAFNGSVNIMNPYIICKFWKRTA